MIILYDKNYPKELIFEVKSFLDIDFKTFKKLFDEYLDKSIKDNINYDVIIDLYDINDYSIYSLKDITYYFTFLSKTKLKFISKIDIYINKNSNLISLLESIQIVSIMPIKILKLDNKKKW